MKIKLTLIIALLITSFAGFANTDDEGSIKDYKAYYATKTVEERKARFEEIEQRVNEIKAIDRSQLSREERKALRAELKDLKKQAKATATDISIYLSLGAVLVILIVLLVVL